MTAERIQSLFFEEYDEPLSRFDGGIYRCCLSDGGLLDHVSAGLCAIIGLDNAQLHSKLGSDYTKLIHPDDVHIYRGLIEDLSQGEAACTVLYRLRTHNGSYVPVSETMVSTCDDEGTVWGYAMVSNLSAASENLLEGHTAPKPPKEVGYETPLHGSVKFKAGNPGELTHIDDSVLRLLGATDSDLRTRKDELVSAAIAIFSENHDIAHVPCNHLQGNPSAPCTIEGRTYLRRFNGSYLRVAFWRKCAGEGENRRCTLFMVASPVLDTAPSGLIEDALRFSADTADLVFRLSYNRSSATCVANSMPELFPIPMHMPFLAPDVYLPWIKDYAAPHHQKAVLDFVTLDKTLALGQSTRYLRFDAKKDGHALDVSALMVADSGDILVVLKLLERPSVAGQGNEVPRSGVFARTFGSFELFIDGEPVVFRNAKAKEYLALLIDRRGGYVSSREAVSCLWEDEVLGEKEYSRARKAAFNMNKTLEKYGIADIAENDGSARRIVPSHIQCDLYDFLNSEDGRERQLRGSYMRDYSWAEATLAELTFDLYEGGA
ncbi:MAG: PAS domain-containing protein [Coriobacteriia bacterium]|nr:PAS domain-containing protein [Coriobacteriia bacterium]